MADNSRAVNRVLSSIPIAKSNRLPKFENVSKAVLKNYRMNSNLILLIKEDGKSILLLYDKSEYTYTAAPSFQTTNAYAGLPFEKTRNGKQ